jgi:hypothetical protein
MIKQLREVLDENRFQYQSLEYLPRAVLETLEVSNELLHSGFGSDTWDRISSARKPVPRIWRTITGGSFGGIEMSFCC